jgi:hypothetical protein
VFDVAVERNVCEGRRGLQGSQGFGVELPFAVLVAEDELSSLVGSGVDDHERPKHVRSPRGVLVRLEERILFWVHAKVLENDEAGECDKKFLP